MQDFMIFSNPDFGKIRTTTISGEPWFVGKDVAAALGYSVTRKAIYDHVDDEDKRGFQIGTPSGEQTMTVINESGLYSLIFSSKLESAKAFKHWVTSEVLPAIRKHGAYMTPETIEAAILNPDTLIQVATALKEERERRLSLETKVEQDQPKVLFADAVAASQTSILIGDLAKLLRQNGVDIGQKRLFSWLREQG